MMDLPSGVKKLHVVRPVPLLMSLRSVPSIFMVKIWSHLYSPVCWNVSLPPSNEKYASAFSPPFVSWRMLESRVSCGRSSGGSAATVTGGGVGLDDEHAAPMVAIASTERYATERDDMRRMISNGQADHPCRHGRVLRVRRATGSA